jgi:D-sedoheptulose 7-phosphate isomerase
MRSLVRRELELSASVIAAVDDDQVLEIADALVRVFRSGNKVILFGNGGSAADAQHLAAEFSGRYLWDRPALRAIAITNVSAITAIGNDYSFEDVFERHVEGLVQSGDAVVAISTSGSSKNVLRAVRRAKQLGAITIGLTGNKGALKEEADLVLSIPSDRTPRIQEGYMAAGHVICGLVERKMFSRPTVFVDRDDTLVKDVPYCSCPEDLHLFPGVGAAVRRLNEAGFLVIMITNQSGVGRGYFTEETLKRVHERLREEIAKEGGRLDGIYYCPHLPEARCGCRKPEVGMVEQALDDFPIDMERSYLIGDSENHDMELARRLGFRSFQVSEARGFADVVDELLELKRC